MEVLIKQVLDEYFADFKNYHLLILVVFTVAIAIIQIFQSIWVSGKIETFKNELKRSEIKFSRYNDLQIKALSRLYQSLAKFQTETRRIKNSEKINPDQYEKTVRSWILIYRECLDNFSKEKYILPIAIKDSYSLMLEEFNEIGDLINFERKYKKSFYLDENGEMELGSEQIEVDGILYKLKKYNRDEVFAKTIENIILLRKSIEELFEKME